MSALPPGFEALEPFVERWALSPASQRAHRRLASTAEERQAFYAVAKDLVAPALEHLDRKPLDAFDPAEQRLMRLMLTFAHVIMAVEVQVDDEPRHAQAARHMRITRAPADA